MPAPEQPTLHKLRVWSCELCWKDADGLNHDYDAPPDGRGWEYPIGATCYCCAAPVIKGVRVQRLVDVDNIKPSAYA